MDNNPNRILDIHEYLPKELSVEICISIIHHVTDQLIILKTINNWPDVGIEEFIKPLQTRFKRAILQDKHFENIIPKQCSFLVSLFSNLLDEMKDEESFSRFSNIVNILVQAKSEDENILKETIEKECEVKTLQEALDNERIDFVDKIINCMADIGRIKDQIENFQTESEVKLNYIKSWQNSKFEMEQTKFLKTFEKTQEKMNSIKFNAEKELRVHREQEFALNEFQEELTKKIGQWKKKYNEILSKMNTKISNLQEKHDKQLGVMSNLKELYAKHQKEMGDWNAYKVQQEKIRLEKERKNKAATKIQAWWRGTMVRKGFGRYRKKKEKKIKKSSEKKPGKKT